MKGFPVISDHNVIYIDCNMKTREWKKASSYVIRDFSNFSTDSYQNELCNCVWPDKHEDIHMTANNFVDNLVKCLDIIAPKKTVSCKGRKRPTNPWFTEEVDSALKERDKLFRIFKISNSALAWNQYKYLRNKATALIKKNKSEYWHGVIDEVKGNSKRMWKTLKCIIKSKSTKSNDDVTEIVFSDGPCKDATLIADKFNQYYVDSILEIVNSIPCDDSDDVINTEVYTDSQMCNFPPVSMSALADLIMDLPNKSCTEEGINANVLKVAFPAIKFELLNVVNLSLASGTFPDNWKLSTIIPIPKVINTKMASEFRPLNMLPVYEKVMEMIVHKELYNYLSVNNLLCDQQSGFRRNHSCESAVQCVVTEWKDVIDKGNLVVAVFLDLKRAFETIDRNILLSKLVLNGIGSNVLKWFESYLSDRVQKVKFNGKFSKELKNDYGVPQGSVLGPLLFLIYINDMSKLFDKCSIHLFADDAVIYCSGDNYEEVVRVLNRELKRVIEWLNQHKLKLNCSKCKALIISTNGKLLKIDVNANPVVLNNEPIEIVQQMKYLGVIVDNNLKFNQHVNFVCKKIGKKIGFMGRVSKCMSVWTKTLIYNTIILPHFDYCSTLFLSINKCDLDSLQKLQNRAMRIILSCDRLTHIKDMLDKLNFLTVKQRIKLASLIFIYKVINNILPKYLKNKFDLINTVHKHVTRANVCKNIFIDFKHKTSTLNSVFNKGAKMYNDLPISCKNSTNVHSFKLQCLDFIRKNDEHSDM